MFGFLSRKSIPSDLSKLKAEHLAELIKREGQAKAIEIARRAADAGSTDCAVFISTALGRSIFGAMPAPPKGVEPEQFKAGLIQQFEYFTEMAAQRGDNGSRFNLAKHYAQKSGFADGDLSLEGYEELKKAEYWHKKAAAEGFAPSTEALERLAPVFSWAHEAFASAAAGARSQYDDSDTNEYGNADADEHGQAGSSYIKDSIAKNGWAGTVTIAMMMVLDRIPNREIAYQFFLEELDGARQGNEASQAAATRSGIAPQKYIGALERSRPEVDGPGGPQQLLMELSFQLAPDRDLMAKFRCDVGRAVQNHFEFVD